MSQGFPSTTSVGGFPALSPDHGSDSQADVSYLTGAQARVNREPCTTVARNEGTSAPDVNGKPLPLHEKGAGSVTHREPEKTAAPIDACASAAALGGDCARTGAIGLSLRPDQRRDPAANTQAAPRDREAPRPLSPALTYRTFKNHYLCDACPLEWEETAVCAGPSFCPACDREHEPYLSIDLLEDA